MLGDGRARQTDTLTALVEAGANVNLADRNGQTPLALAQARDYDAMVAVLRQANALRFMDSLSPGWGRGIAGGYR